MLTDAFHSCYTISLYTGLTPFSSVFHDLDNQHMTDANGRQGMLNPPRHIFPHFFFEVHLRFWICILFHGFILDGWQFLPSKDIKGFFHTGRKITIISGVSANLPLPLKRIYTNKGFFSCQINKLRNYWLWKFGNLRNMIQNCFCLHLQLQLGKYMRFMITTFPLLK